MKTISHIFFCYQNVFIIFREEKGIPLDSGSSTTSSTNVNPLNGTPYTKNYFNLLEKRTQLPVFEYREDFMRLLAEHQCIVLVGETGSGLKSF